MPVNARVERMLDAAQKTNGSKALGVIINGKAITMGQYVPKAEAQTAPEISFTAANSSTTYMVVCLDLDAPFQSWPFLGPILHWIQPGFKAGANDSLTSKEPFVANYIGPGPPPISGPHRYVFFLFEQPDSFDGKRHAPANGQPMGAWSRMRYDFDKWQKEAGVGELLAINYFVSN